MSLPPSPDFPIPEETVRVAHAAFPQGNVFMRMRDALGPIYCHPPFARLFSQTGQPAEAPARLALALVLPFAEGLANRQAANAVRSRIDWKYALGLELTDPGFDDSVLSEFRTRLIAGEGEHLRLETMLMSLQERGLLNGRGTPRTDSTQSLAAIRTLTRLAWVGETMRFALNRLAAVAPAWLQPTCTPSGLSAMGRVSKTLGFPRLRLHVNDWRAPLAPMDSPSSRPSTRQRYLRRCGLSPRWKFYAASGSNHRMGRTIRPAGGRTGMGRRRLG